MHGSFPSVHHEPHPCIWLSAMTENMKNWDVYSLTRQKTWRALFWFCHTYKISSLLLYIFLIQLIKFDMFCYCEGSSFSSRKMIQESEHTNIILCLSFQTSRRVHKSLQIYNRDSVHHSFLRDNALHHLHYKRRKNTGLARVPGIHVGELLLQGRELKLLVEVPIWHTDDKQSSRTIES